jgi:hypothetical protein
VLRLGKLVYGRLLFAVQILVLAVRLCLKIGFRHIAQQPRQSLIATTSRRSALDCGRRSSPNNRYLFSKVFPLHLAVDRHSKTKFSSQVSAQKRIFVPLRPEEHKNSSVT